MKEPWFERTGLISHRVISPKGRLLQLVIFVLFFGLGVGSMGLEETNPTLSTIFAAAAILAAVAGFWMMFRHTRQPPWTN